MMNDNKPINKQNFAAAVGKLKRVLNPTITQVVYLGFGIKLITDISSENTDVVSFSVKSLSHDSSGDKTIYCIGYLYKESGSNEYCATNLGSQLITEVGSFVEDGKLVLLLIPDPDASYELLKTEAEAFISDDNKNHVTDIVYLTETEYDYYADNNALFEVEGDLDVNFYYSVRTGANTYEYIQNGGNGDIESIYHSDNADELTHDIDLTVVGTDSNDNEVITGHIDLLTGDSEENTLNLTVDTDVIIDAVKADFTLDPATDQELGGIKLTTLSSLSANQFPVELDLNNAAYVDLTTFNPDVTVDIFRFESMPSDSTVAGTTLVQYIGESTADYTYGYFYTWAPTNFTVTPQSDAWSEVLSSETGVKIAQYNKENNYIFNTTDPLVITLQDELEAGNSILPTTKFSVVQGNIFSDTLTLAQIQDKLGFEMKLSYIIYDPTKDYNLSISLETDTSAWKQKNVQPTLSTDTDLTYKGSCIYADLEAKIPTAKVGDFYTITDKSNQEYFFNGTITSDWEDSWEYMGEVFTPYQDFDGITHGLVPVSGDPDKILNGVGNWIDVPSTNVKSDWNAIPGANAEILNRPNLAPVATSGNYNDLSNKPTFVANNGSDIGQVGNPEVTSSTTGNTTVLTFHKLKGQQGVQGDAATITVGSVTSGAAASVINSGTTSAAVLDFVLPKGDTGDNGDTPYIDPTSKHWIIGSVDTNVVAEGQNGANGTNGTNGADGDDGITPHIDPTTKHWMIDTVDTGIVAEGKDGTGVNVKADQASCTQVGDSYIDANGHLQVLTDITTIPYTFTDAGEIKGPAGVSCTHSWSGTVLTVTSSSGTSSADLQGPAGQNGADGTNGTSAVWFTGTAVSHSTGIQPVTVAGSKTGDMYLNTSNYNVYSAVAPNTWQYQCNIKGATGVAGTLNTTNTVAQTASAAESFNGTINLHKVSKTGSYNDLSNKPSIPSVSDSSNYITINGNGSTTGTSINSFIPVGTIQMYAGISSPSGWLICDGALIPTTTTTHDTVISGYEDYQNLLDVVSDTYGAKNTGIGLVKTVKGEMLVGYGVFIPNFLGRFPLGVGESNATGHTNHSIGDTGGEEKHTLLTTEMPSHTHDYDDFHEVMANTAAGHKNCVSYEENRAQSETPAHTRATGGGASHNNMPPFLTVNFMIKY